MCGSVRNFVQQNRIKKIVYTIILKIAIIMIQFLLHIHKIKSISSPCSNRSGIICNNFVSYPPSNIHNSERRLCPITFYSCKKVCGKAFHQCVGDLGLRLPPIFLLIHTSHKYIKMKSWTDPTFSFPSKENSSTGQARLKACDQQSGGCP